MYILQVYIGGFEEGPSDDAPGLIYLAFCGKLRPLLIESGALEPIPGTDVTENKTTSTASTTTIHIASGDTVPTPTTSSKDENKLFQCLLVRHDDNYKAIEDSYHVKIYKTKEQKN